MEVPVRFDAIKPLRNALVSALAGTGTGSTTNSTTTGARDMDVAEAGEMAVARAVADTAKASVMRSRFQAIRMDMLFWGVGFVIGFWAPIFSGGDDFWYIGPFIFLLLNIPWYFVLHGYYTLNIDGLPCCWKSDHEHSTIEDLTENQAAHPPQVARVAF